MAAVQVNKEPIRHPDCCLSLSSTLLDKLTITLIRVGAEAGRLVLSIGSGSGLLEALLLEKWSTSAGAILSIEGIEVQQSVSTSLNKFLPEQHHSSVKGTWDLSPRAADASALMFVYPRNPDLVSGYLQSYALSTDAALDTVIYLGPKCDWAEFEQCFSGLNGWSTNVVPDEESGLLEYEMLAVAERR
ncbi:hypothetical protein BKA67DRAFT_652430 [Truncatella angustata]|uniref:Uncharacterized protein n=1 Tax=Truncatella angustata TaxID=152316 RepID=A0A9P8UW84_9PEZI|nr:uncharacterized protein BKA67DRAFT_652430 [Truncatella angustata]KAH6659181.1 hypothetical protein BKA67DRAFT_652430 [Truncatella angustata]